MFRTLDRIHKIDMINKMNPENLVNPVKGPTSESRTRHQAVAGLSLLP
jgi:hypothetical protein